MQKDIDEIKELRKKTRQALRELADTAKVPVPPLQDYLNDDLYMGSNLNVQSSDQYHHVRKSPSRTSSPSRRRYAPTQLKNMTVSPNRSRLLKSPTRYPSDFRAIRHNGSFSPTQILKYENERKMQKVGYYNLVFYCASYLYITLIS